MFLCKRSFHRNGHRTGKEMRALIKSKQMHRPQLVLVVDDQEINRDALGVILEDEYEILYAENGKQALELMRENAERLSIVLLDLMMPVMSGFEVLETVRSDEL